MVGSFLEDVVIDILIPSQLDSILDFDYAPLHYEF